VDGAGLRHNGITFLPTSLTVSFFPSPRIAHHREPLFIGMPPVTFCIVIYSAKLFACLQSMCVEHPRLSYVSTRSLVFIDAPRVSYRIHAHCSRCIHSAHGFEGILDFFFRTHERTRASSPGKFVAVEAYHISAFRVSNMYGCSSSHPQTLSPTLPSNFFFSLLKPQFQDSRALRVLTCPRRISSFMRPDRPDQLRSEVSQSRCFFAFFSILSFGTFLAGMS
jgi:hypothetical protein